MRMDNIYLRQVWNVKLWLISRMSQPMETFVVRSTGAGSVEMEEDENYGEVIEHGRRVNGRRKEFWIIRQAADDENQKKIFWLISKMFRPADLVVRESVGHPHHHCKDFQAEWYDHQGLWFKVKIVMINSDKSSKDNLQEKLDLLFGPWMMIVNVFKLMKM